jgi:hypothetical protein
MDKMYSTDIYRVFHSTAADYIFFLAIHEALPKIDHILGNEENPKK